jgi:hypothetical protein
VYDELRYRVRITDPARVEPFENQFILRVRPVASPPTKPKSGTSQRPPAPANKKGKEREKPSLLAMPPITPVKEPDWSKHGFSKNIALKVKHAGTSETDSPDPTTTTYDFFVNVDHQSLRAEQKRSKTSPQVLEARFTYALVLIGLALLQEGRQVEPETTPGTDGEEDPDQGAGLEAQVERFANAVAPILLPMIELLPELGASEEPG